MNKQGHAEAGTVEFSAGDIEDFDALYEELRGVPGVKIQSVPAPIVDGEQGSALDLLTVSCSGGAITVVLQVVKALVESRGPRFTLKIRRGKDRLEVTADNIEDVLPAIRDLLDES